MDILSKLPERLKELMADKGINAPILAKQIGVRNNTLTEQLRGAHLPTFEVFISFLEYFNCSADFLLGLIDYPRRENQIFNPTPCFAAQFRIAMEKCKMSQYALQKKTKISWANFNAWLNGKSLPYLDSLVKLAKGLDCSVDFLLGREN